MSQAPTIHLFLSRAKRPPYRYFSQGLQASSIHLFLSRAKRPYTLISLKSQTSIHLFLSRAKRPYTLISLKSQTFLYTYFSQEPSVLKHISQKGQVPPTRPLCSMQLPFVADLYFVCCILHGHKHCTSVKCSVPPAAKFCSQRFTVSTCVNSPEFYGSKFFSALNLQQKFVLRRAARAQ